MLTTKRQSIALGAVYGGVLTYGRAEKYSSAVHKFLKELAKGEFPVSEPVSEASSKYGSAYVSSPVFFVLGEIIAVQWWLERDSNIV
ncbi:hypothetical protein ACLB2K_012785 [Fragaria x ananassa]